MGRMLINQLREFLLETGFTVNRKEEFKVFEGDQGLLGSKPDC